MKRGLIEQSQQQQQQQRQQQWVKVGVLLLLLRQLQQQQTRRWMQRVCWQGWAHGRPWMWIRLVETKQLLKLADQSMRCSVSVSYQDK
jgi:hypothetical protein